MSDYEDRDENIEALEMGVLTGLSARECPSCDKKHPVLLLQTALGDDGDTGYFILEIPPEGMTAFGGLKTLIRALTALDKEFDAENARQAKSDLN